MRVNHCGVIAEIDTLPGCSQISIIHGVYLDLDHRGHGDGMRGQKFRLEDLENTYGYDVALCTVELTNKRNIHILETNGWKFQFSFKSRKTGHKVALYARGLGQELNPVPPPKPDYPVERYYSDYIHPDEIGRDPLSMVM